MPRRTARQAVGFVVAGLAATLPATLVAQGTTVSGSAQDTQITLALDGGVASVAYDDFLRSTVGTLTPSLRVEHGRVTFTAHGAYSRFAESGNHSIEGAAAASVISPSYWNLRGELFGTASSTRYSSIDEAATNVLGVARLHWASATQGLWVGAGVGGVTQAIFGDNGFGQLDVGGWLRSGAGTFTVQVLPSRIGAKRYTDAVGSARWEPERGELTLSGGYRSGERAGGARMWAESGAAYWFARHLAIVAGYGVFPAELWRGLPGGHYASAALRLATRAPRASDPRRLAALTAPYEIGALRRRGVPAAQQFTVSTESDGTRTLRLRVPGATRVELMGDFTDWTAVALTPVPGPSGAEYWTFNVFLSPGVHRLDIRVDGGPWAAPPGLTTVRDEFGGSVGLLVVQ